ncbi:hypothetical protein JYU34_004408 [Plutella xylostella]|uniref:FLYWCH-type domain-containing protein n=1 Tax=Plutella xylostella TaxID=51655 RepID=A0ABQ7QXY0_PLUXY|nr:hypothetical protein JYU34_004408 [Plutella xylostella]
MLLFIPVTFLKTSKGKTHIKVGSHTFYARGGNCKKESQRWCCTQNKYCRARLHVENNAIVAIFNHHNHEKK